MVKKRPNTREASNFSRGIKTKIPTAKRADLSKTKSVTPAEVDRTNDCIAELTKSIYEMENLPNQATDCSEQITEDVSEVPNTIDERLTRLEYRIKCIAIQIREFLTSWQTMELCMRVCPSLLIRRQPQHIYTFRAPHPSIRNCKEDEIYTTQQSQPVEQWPQLSRLPTDRTLVCRKD